MSYYPLFIELTDKNCLVVGGGAVAGRKVRMLLDFGARVHVVAKRINDELLLLAKEHRELVISEREFQKEDLSAMFLVIAATDDDALNSQISHLCKEKNIHINVVDKIEECSFIVPAYIKEKNVTAAFSSGGRAPVMTQYLKSRAKEFITGDIGEINECLGGIRSYVLETFPTEAIRKEVFRRVLEYALSNDTIPTEKEMEIIISQIKNKYEC